MVFFEREGEPDFQDEEPQPLSSDFRASQKLSSASPETDIPLNAVKVITPEKRRVALIADQLDEAGIRAQQELQGGDE